MPSCSAISIAQEEARNQAVVELAKRLKLPLLATNGVCHATPAQREVADVFTCLQKSCATGKRRTVAGNQFRSDI